MNCAFSFSVWVGLQHQKSVYIKMLEAGPMMGASILVSGGAKVQSHDALDWVSSSVYRNWR